MDPAKVLADGEYDRIVSYVTGGKGYGGLGGLMSGSNGDERARRRTALWSCALGLLGECGLRVGELVGLQISDIWGGTDALSAVVVRAEVAKYGTARLVPLCGGAFEVARVFGHFRGADCDRGPVDRWLVSCAGAQGLTARTVQRWTSAWGAQAIGRQVHPHAFRHFCINRLRRVADIVTVAAIAGHRSIKTTQAYTHVGGQDMRGAMERANGSNASG